MSLEHAHARVSEFLETFCAQTTPSPPDGDSDAISYLDQHVLTATDLRTLLNATVQITPTTLQDRFDVLPDWAKRALRAVVAQHEEAHAEAQAAEDLARDHDTAVFWRGAASSRHYLPPGAPVTFVLSRTPPNPAAPNTTPPDDQPDTEHNEIRAIITDGCLMITTPDPTRVLAVTPMSHRALCISTPITPDPPLTREGTSAP